MYNYYEYCKNIGESYYPKIYSDIKVHIDKVLKEVDANDLHPFPMQKNFEGLVNRAFESYKKSIYKDVIEGRISSANYTNDDVVNIMKDFIRILFIQEILKSRERFSDYPYYF